MTNPALGVEPIPLPRPAPVESPDYTDGSPASIELHARELMAQLNAGSIDAAGFADNVEIALTAMGVGLPAAFKPMIIGAVASGFSDAPPVA